MTGGSRSSAVQQSDPQKPGDCSPSLYEDPLSNGEDHAQRIAAHHSSSPSQSPPPSSSPVPLPSAGVSPTLVDGTKDISVRHDSPAIHMGSSSGVPCAAGMEKAAIGAELASTRPSVHVRDEDLLLNLDVSPSSPRCRRPLKGLKCGLKNKRLQKAKNFPLPSADSGSSPPLLEEQEEGRPPGLIGTGTGSCDVNDATGERLKKLWRACGILTGDLPVQIPQALPVQNPQALSVQIPQALPSAEPGEVAVAGSVGLGDLSCSLDGRSGGVQYEMLPADHDEMFYDEVDDVVHDFYREVDDVVRGVKMSLSDDLIPPPAAGGLQRHFRGLRGLKNRRWRKGLKGFKNRRWHWKEGWGRLKKRKKVEGQCPSELSWTPPPVLASTAWPLRRLLGNATCTLLDEVASGVRELGDLTELGKLRDAMRRKLIYFLQCGEYKIGVVDQNDFLKAVLDLPGDPIPPRVTGLNGSFINGIFESDFRVAPIGRWTLRHWQENPWVPPIGYAAGDSGMIELDAADIAAIMTSTLCTRGVTLFG